MSDDPRKPPPPSHPQSVPPDVPLELDSSWDDDTMPRLDIFQAYSVYSVAVMAGSGIRHALRLGFFREEVSAQIHRA